MFGIITANKVTLAANPTYEDKYFYPVISDDEEYYDPTMRVFETIELAKYEIENSSFRKKADYNIIINLITGETTIIK